MIWGYPYFWKHPFHKAFRTIYSCHVLFVLHRIYFFAHVPPKVTRFPTPTPRCENRKLWLDNLHKTTTNHSNTHKKPAVKSWLKGLLFRRESAFEQCWLDTTNVLVHLGIVTHLWYHQGMGENVEKDMNGWPLWKWGKCSPRHPNTSWGLVF